MSPNQNWGLYTDSKTDWFKILNVHWAQDLVLLLLQMCPYVYKYWLHTGTRCGHPSQASVHTGFLWVVQHVQYNAIHCPHKNMSFCTQNGRACWCHNVSALVQGDVSMFFLGTLWCHLVSALVHDDVSLFFLGTLWCHLYYLQVLNARYLMMSGRPIESWCTTQATVE